MYINYQWLLSVCGNEQYNVFVLIHNQRGRQILKSGGGVGGRIYVGFTPTHNPPMHFMISSHDLLHLHIPKLKCFVILTKI